MGKKALRIFQDGTINTDGNLIEVDSRLRNGRNLFNSKNIATWGTTNQYARIDSTISYHTDSGGGLRISDTTFDSNTYYVFSFLYKKVNGVINKIGGHSLNFSTTAIEIDEIRYSDANWSNGIPVPDDNEWHLIKVYMKSRSSLDNVDNNLYIQPNRPSYGVSYSIEIKDIKVEKGSKYTPYSPTPEELGYSIPSSVNNLKDPLSITDNDIVTAEIVEIPTILSSGRNLLLNSHREITGSTEYLGYTNLAPVFDKHGVGRYTVSFDLKTAINGSIQVYFSDRVTELIKYRWNPASFNLPTTTEFKRYSITFDASILTPTATISVLAFYGVYNSGVKPTVKNVKVERGSMATPWCPAPEDLGIELPSYVNIIGGSRNILKNSKIDATISSNNNVTTPISRIKTIENGDEFYRIARRSGTINDRMSLYNAIPLSNLTKEIRTGEKFTISFEVRASHSKLFSIMSYYQPNGGGATQQFGTSDRVINTEWQTVSQTFSIIDNSTSNPVIRFCPYASSLREEELESFYIDIKNYKIEQGENPNPIWSPAPEDLGYTFPDSLQSFNNPVSIGESHVSASSFSEYPNIITGGLKIWYDFKGLTNTDMFKDKAFDLSGNNNDGIIKNLTYNDRGGYNSKSLMLNGSNQRIDTGVSLTSKFTFELLAKPVNFQHSHLISVHKDGSTGFLFQLSASNTYQMYIGSVNKTLKNPVLNEYVYITFSHDGTNVIVYFNGAYYTSVTATEINDGFIFIGDRDNNTRPFFGDIDMFRFYNRALSADEVLYNYTVQTQ